MIQLLTVKQCSCSQTVTTIDSYALYQPKTGFQSPSLHVLKGKSDIKHWFYLLKKVQIQYQGNQILFFLLALQRILCCFVDKCVFVSWWIYPSTLMPHGGFCFVLSFNQKLQKMVTQVYNKERTHAGSSPAPTAYHCPPYLSTHRQLYSVWMCIHTQRLRYIHVHADGYTCVYTDTYAHMHKYMHTHRYKNFTYAYIVFIMVFHKPPVSFNIAASC